MNTRSSSTNGFMEIAAQLRRVAAVPRWLLGQTKYIATNAAAAVTTRYGWLFPLKETTRATYSGQIEHILAEDWDDDEWHYISITEQMEARSQMQPTAPLNDKWIPCSNKGSGEMSASNEQVKAQKQEPGVPGRLLSKKLRECIQNSLCQTHPPLGLVAELQLLVYLREQESRAKRANSVGNR